jgi:hypothetical protein
VRKAVTIKPRRSPWLATVIMVVLVLVGIYLWQLSRTAANPELPQLASGLAIGAALVVLLFRILRR